MRFMVLHAFWRLILFDPCFAGGDFAALYEQVGSCPVGKLAGGPEVIEKACAAVDMASIWYWKEVLCLQRSAAAACLLRRCGVRAEMLIGAQRIPFKAHAWVEVEGRVVNDRPYVREIYAVLDRC